MKYNIQLTGFGKAAYWFLWCHNGFLLYAVVIGMLTRAYMDVLGILAIWLGALAFLLILKEKDGFVLLQRDMVVIDMLHRYPIAIWYSEISGCEIYPVGKRGGQVCLRYGEGRRCVRIELKRLEPFLTDLYERMGQSRLHRSVVPLRLEEMERFRDRHEFWVSCPAWGGWLFTAILTGCTAYIVYCICAPRSAAEYYLLLCAVVLLIVAFSGLLRRIYVDQNGLSITRLFFRRTEYLLWNTVTSVRYLRDGEKVPLTQPGHGRRNKTLVLEFDDGKTLAVSVSEPGRFYHLVRTCLENRQQLYGWPETRS